MSYVVISTIVCIAMTIVMLFSYFTKQRVATDDNKIFQRILVLLLFILTLEFAGVFFHLDTTTSIVIKSIIKKLYLFTVLFWGVLFCMFCISTKTELTKIKIRKTILITNTIFFLLLLFAPISFVAKELNIITIGPAYYVFVVIMLIEFFYIFYFLLRYRNDLGDKKRPIITLVILMLTAGLSQLLIPEYMLLTFSMTVVTLSMYLNIENPDIKMLKQVELAKKIAEKSNNAKTEFLSSMSHEIRTPLNAIVGLSEIIKDSNDIEEINENAKDIINASNTLLDIVNSILDISKIEAGKLEMNNINYDPTNLFNSAAKLLKTQFTNKGLKFNVNISKDLPEVLIGDGASLKKIITNLLSNANKYTIYGTINFNVSCINKNGISRLTISVEDTGTGIKKEDINNLYKKFSRLEEIKNSSIEGTGLGLAITKELVELMGGQIIVESNYGEGTKFTVILNQRISKEKIEKKLEIDTTNITLENKSILVVDDNPLNLRVTEKILEKYKANVTSVDNGEDCVKIIRQQDFDVILMDDMMPKITGTETLNKLKELPKFNSKVIVLTSNAIEGMREKYLAAGFDGYVSKPINVDDLLIEIETLSPTKTDII